MSEKRKVVLIHPFADRACLPDLAEALRRRGAEVQQVFLSDDYSVLLDALENDVVPVVVKG